MNVQPSRPSAQAWTTYSERLIGAIDESDRLGQRTLKTAAYNDARQHLIYEALANRLTNNRKLKALFGDRIAEVVTSALAASRARVNPLAHVVPEETYVGEIRAATARFRNRPDEPITERALNEAVSKHLLSRIDDALEQGRQELDEQCRRTIERRHGAPRLPETSADVARLRRVRPEIDRIAAILNEEFDAAKRSCHDLKLSLERAVASANRALMLAHPDRDEYPLQNLDVERIDLPLSKTRRSEKNRPYPSAYELALPLKAKKGLDAWNRRIRMRVASKQMYPRVLPFGILAAGVIARAATGVDRAWIAAMGGAFVASEPTTAILFAAREAQAMFAFKVRNGEQVVELESETSSIGKTRRTLEERMGTQWRVSLEYWATGRRQLQPQTAFDVGQVVRTSLRRPMRLTPLVEHTPTAPSILDRRLVNRLLSAFRPSPTIVPSLNDALAEAASQSAKLFTEEHEVVKKYLIDRAMGFEEEDVLGIRCLSRLPHDGLDGETREYIEYLCKNPRVQDADDLNSRAATAYGMQFGTDGLRNVQEAGIIYVSPSREADRLEQHA